MHARKRGPKRTSRGLTGVLRWVGVLVIGALIGLGAGSYVLDRPEATADDVSTPDTTRVEQGTLGRTLRLPATGAWEVAGVIQSPAGGVITAIMSKSGVLEPGSILLRIDERPVVLVPGDVPAFREMSVGTRGRDVAALQGYLASLGYKVDRSASRYTKVTAAAVRRWQRRVGASPTGVVALGDVVLIPTSALNAPLRWVDAVTVGATIAAGAPIMERRAPSPTLTIEFGGSPPAQLEPGVAGEVTFPNGDTRAITLSAIRQENGRTWATLAPVDGSLCQVAACLALVPANGDTPVDVTFTLVPETTGPMIPVAAIQSDAAGRAFVELPDGSRKTVTVVVASGGSAIVDGLAVGEEIVLP